MNEPPPSIVTNVLAPVKIPKRAAAMLDGTQQRVFAEAVRNVRLANALLVAHGMDNLVVTGSYFRVDLSVLVEDVDGLVVTVRPNLKADVTCPGLDEKWRLFLDSIFPGAPPGGEVEEETPSTYSGLRRALRDGALLDIDTSAGIRWDWPPEPFVTLELGRSIEVAPMRVAPEQRFYWIEGDGFGSSSSVRLDLWLMKRLVARSRSAMSISESSEGWEWEQRLSLAYILAGKANSPTHAIGVRADARGHHDDGEWKEDLYRASALYRFPLYSDWLFVRLAAGVEWRPEDGWQTVPFGRFGIDARFGGY